MTAVNIRDRIHSPGNPIHGLPFVLGAPFRVGSIVDPPSTHRYWTISVRIVDGARPEWLRRIATDREVFEPCKQRL